MTLKIVRVWLPIAIIVAGLVVVVATNASEAGLEGGALLIGAGLAVWLLNYFFRLGVGGERDREAEEQAREYFDRHGRWPDDGARRPSETDARSAADRAPHHDSLDSGHGRSPRR